MKKLSLPNYLLSLFLLLTTFQNISAQLEIEWEKTFGGSEFDIAISIQETSDLGFIVAGNSFSTDGDFTDNKGGRDAYLMKLDQEGNLEWKKNYGGSADDAGYAVTQTDDGGYFLSGFASSIDGDVSSNNGQHDIWVLKLDPQGNIEWEKNYGGSFSERAASYYNQQTNDGGYIVTGFSSSSDGDVSGNYSLQDYWVLKLDANGNLEWENHFGGSSTDYPYSIRQTMDNGYIVAGYSDSPDFDISFSLGLEDVWIVKLDPEGNIEWERNYGGTYPDRAYCIEQTPDGGYIVAGETYSMDGNVSFNNGETDIWVFKIDAEANLEWEKTFGGSQREWATSIELTENGGYLISGTTESYDGDVLTNYGGTDFWLLQIDSEGNLEWDQNYGGTENERAFTVKSTSDGSYIICGLSESSDGDVSPTKGGDDIWIVKFSENPVATSETDFDSNITILPNPTQGQFSIDIDEEIAEVDINIYNSSGIYILGKRKVQKSMQVENLPKGHYYITAKTQDKMTVKKLIIF